MEKINPSDINVVLFHAGCPDGTGSAFSFYLYHKKHNIRNVIYYGVKHYQSYPKELIKNKNVIIADFSYNKNTTIDLAKHAKNVVILDHHETTYNNLKDIEKVTDNVSLIYDSERSGAQIAWDYVFNYEPRPLFIEYIADRDLWEWKLPESKNINTGMYHKGYTKNLVNMYKLYISESLNRNFYNSIIKIGKEINMYEEKRCKVLSKHSKLALFQGLRTRIVTAEANIVSDLADHIFKNYNDCDIVLNYNFHIDDGWYVQLRSTNVDLTYITKKYNRGGGHPNSAGFKLPNTDHINNHIKILG